MRTLWRIPFALAALWVFTVTDTYAADEVVSDCGDNGGANQLRAKLAAVQSSGGGTITFTCSTPIEIWNGVLPTISTNTVINGGNGVVIDGAPFDGPTRAFLVASGGTLTLNNVTIRSFDGKNGDGGAIRNDGTLNINHSKFLNNVTSANWSGGAIVSYGPLNISESEFGFNLGGGAGAVYPRHGSVVTIAGSSFHHNRTLNEAGSGWGGAILIWDGPTVTIEGSSFRNNGALKDGGAIYVTPNSELDISDSTFSNNSAAWSGGALYVESNSRLDISHSTFSENQAQYGGGIYVDAGTVTTIQTSILSGNRAIEDFDVGYGGGIFLAGPATLMNLTISNNQASVGGGIHISGDPGTLTNSTVSGNRSGVGGGISNYNFSPPFVATNVTISGNSAGQGGGIYGYAKLTNVTLVNNTGTEGSGIYHTGSSTILKNTILSNIGPGANCFVNLGEPPTSEGYNISSDNTCAPYLNQAGDLNNTNPLLGTLADNGGFTQTHMPQNASPARNKIPTGMNGCGTTLTTDQRDISRPQENMCEIGAVEVAALPTSTPTRTRTLTPTITKTPTTTSTSTITKTPTTTLTNTPTITAPPTSTNTPTITAPPMPTRTPTATPTTQSCAVKPAKPTLKVPVDGATLDTQRPTLKWEKVACASKYKVVVKDASTGAIVVRQGGLTQLKYKTAPLPTAKEYKWFVRACNPPYGCAKSASRIFRIQ